MSILEWVKENQVHIRRICVVVGMLGYTCGMLGLIKLGIGLEGVLGGAVLMTLGILLGKPDLL